MSMIPARVAASLSIVAIAATSIAGAQVDPPNEVRLERNRLEAAPSVQFQVEPNANVFHAFGEGSKFFHEQSERFRDPKQRALIRAEQRQQILESHRDIGDILELDAATQAKLI